MLKQRIFTAIVLLAILITAMVYEPLWPFTILTLVMMAAAAWEWGRMNSPHPASRWVLVVCTLALCLLGGSQLAQNPATYIFTPSGVPPTAQNTLTVSSLSQQLGYWLLAAGFWLLLVPLFLWRGASAWPRLPSGLRLALGMLILAAAWMGLMQLRLIGINMLLSCMALVWVADTGAYAAGKAFGKHKLAPAISPGKSWEGALGGFAAVLVLAFLWLWLDKQFAGQWRSKSIYTQLQAHWGLFGMLLTLVVFTAMSICGDLFESLMKRAAGIKDSSGLLPGHGGVLDRIDALLPTFVLCMLCITGMTVLSMGDLGLASIPD